VPVSAVKLVEQIAFYAAPKSKAVLNVKDVPVLPAPHQADEVDAIRAQLAESSARLHKILDPQWQEFLALPADFYAEGKTPTKEAFAKCFDRYGVVASDARYQSLSAHPEFRETHALLLRYRSALEGSNSTTVKLPPPPK
jgi:hypothetical protein